MSLTLPNTSLSDPPNKTEIEDNDAALAEKFNGNIVDDDISGSAAIGTAKLAARDFEFVLSVKGLIGEITFSTTTPSFYIPLPGTSGDGTYTVTDVSWFCSDVGDQTTDFTVTWGRFSAGSWSASGTIATITNMTGENGANTAGHATETDSTVITLGASDATMIGIHFPNAQGTGFMSTTATDQFVVSLKLKRTNGLV